MTTTTKSILTAAAAGTTAAVMLWPQAEPPKPIAVTFFNPNEVPLLAVVESTTNLLTAWKAETNFMVEGKSAGRFDDYDTQQPAKFYRVGFDSL